MFQKPSLGLIQERYSCRIFDGKPVAEAKLLALRAFIEGQGPGPFGTRPRFGLVAAQANDTSMLRGLGTYGFIKNASAYLVGAAGRNEEDLIDFGYLAELAVLKATELGLGSCWLGGTFQRSRFAASVGLDSRYDDEGTGQAIICVIALGNFPLNSDPRQGFIRKRAGGAYRKANNELFFDTSWGTPYNVDDGKFDPDLLQALRLAPSASNKQPWRLVISSESQINFPRAHLYLQRTKGYSNFFTRLAKVADIQVVDMGIALAHLLLVASEKGMSAAISRHNPNLPVDDPLIQYIASLNC